MAEIFTKIAKTIGTISSEIALLRFKDSEEPKTEKVVKKSSKRKSSKKVNAVKYDDKIYKVLRNRKINYIDHAKEKTFKALIKIINQVRFIKRKICKNIDVVCLGTFVLNLALGCPRSLYFLFVLYMTHIPPKNIFFWWSKYYKKKPIKIWKFFKKSYFISIFSDDFVTFHRNFGEKYIFCFCI